MPKSISQLIEETKKELVKLTGLKPSSTLGAVKDEKGWRISVEMIEKHSIPDQMDVLATYEALVNEEGNLLEFKRIKMRKRMETGERE